MKLLLLGRLGHNRSGFLNFVVCQMFLNHSLVCQVLQLKKYLRHQNKARIPGEELLEADVALEVGEEDVSVFNVHPQDVHRLVALRAEK